MNANQTQAASPMKQAPVQAKHGPATPVKPSNLRGLASQLAKKDNSFLMEIHKGISLTPVTKTSRKRGRNSMEELVRQGIKKFRNNDSESSEISSEEESIF